jgi:cytochrome c-type biogenesis protein CcmH
MGLWLELGLMTLAAVGHVVAPLLRRTGRAASRRDYDLRVYRAQLSELAREQERGLLGEREAAAARLEVERRMLAADAAARPSAGGAPARGRRWPTALALAIALPAVAGGLYWVLGNPGQPAAPFAQRAEERRQMAGAAAREEESLAAVETMIARLEERLNADPDDLEGWLRLGQAYALTGRFDQAAATYREAARRDDSIAALHSALGETLVMAGGGGVSPEALAAFEKALALDADDARARYYVALAMLQRGEQQGALDAWVALMADTPEGTPWLPDLRQRAAALAEELGLDPAQALPAARVAPPAEPTTEPPVDAAALRRAATDLEAALAANPKDYQGWIRLAQTWAQLGEPVRAQEALRRGSETYSGAPFVQQQFQMAATELGLEPGDAPGRRGPSAEQMEAAREMPAEDRDQMIRGMVAELAARLEQQPDDLEGWRMLGRSRAVLGEPEESAKAYAEVARRLPDDVTAQVDYAAALLAVQDTDAAPAPAVVEQFRKVLELDPDNPEALFHLGRAAAIKGDAAGAAEHWRQLLAQLPAGSPERAAIEDLLQDLAAGG